MTPPKKQWYDKLADALLGDDELSAKGTPNRYALICQKCFLHNGLVKEEQWEDARKSRTPFLVIKCSCHDVEYVCPKCGHFNPSQRSIKSGNPTSPPTSPGSISQVQRRKTGPRKSEPAGPSNSAMASGVDRRKSLPAPDLGTGFADAAEERPPVPPLPAQFAQQRVPIFAGGASPGSDSDSGVDEVGAGAGSHPQSEEMEIDS